jgi:hypothetical protein
MALAALPDGDNRFVMANAALGQPLRAINSSPLLAHFTLPLFAELSLQ